MIRASVLFVAVILLSAQARAHEFEEAYENEIFAMEKCRGALDFAYQTYKFTQDMSKILQPGPETTNLYYVYCITYEKSAAESVVLVHPKEELVGKNGEENGDIIKSAIARQLAFASDSDIDGGLSMPTYKLDGVTLKDDKIKKSLIMMIYGKGKKDIGKKYVCGCGISEEDPDKAGAKFFDDDDHMNEGPEEEDDHAHGPDSHTHDDD